MTPSLPCQRDAFDLGRDDHYLNCAYMGPLPRVAAEAGFEAIRNKGVPTRIVPPDSFWDTDELRRLYARLIGASEPARVAIQPGVSYAVATAAKNLPVSAGQNIVLTHEQFPGNVYSWHRLAAECHASIRAVDPGEGEGRGQRWNERLLDAIDSRTAIVSVPNVHWTDGTLFHLDAIGARCREVGAALVIDATQSAGALPLDVTSIHPDVVVTAAYKWLLGPYSLAFTWFSDRFEDGVPIEETWIARKNSRDFQHLVDYQNEYIEGAVRYDMAERSSFFLAPIARASLELILAWSPQAIQTYCRDLTADFLRESAELGYSVEDDAWRGSHLFGLRMPEGIDLLALKASLAARNVSASLRGSALRLSPNVYNDRVDVDALFDVLKGAVR